MKTIPLTKGYEALVDDADYEMLSQWKWMASICGRKPYATRFCNRKVIYMHRLLMGFPAGRLDHANRNTLDNQRLNLRTCTNSQNASNRSINNNKSGIGFHGVHRGRTGNWSRWRPVVELNGKRFFCGYFRNPIAAAVARDKMAIRLHGKFAALNFATHIPLQVVN